MNAFFAPVAVLALGYFVWCVKKKRAMREQTIARIVQAALAAVGAVLLLGLGLFPDLILENQEVLHHLRLAAVLAVFPCLKELSDCVRLLRKRVTPKQPKA